MFDCFYSYLEDFPNELKYLVDLSRKAQNQQGIFNEYGHVDYNQLLTLIDKHGLAPLIFRQLKEASPGVGEDRADPFNRYFYARQERTMALLREGLLLTRELEDRGVPYMMVKGPVLSQMLYDDPLQKHSLDIDLVLPVEFVETVHTLLLEREFHRTYPQQSLTGKQKRVNYQLTHHYGYIKKGRHNIALEIHWALINPVALVPLSFDSLYARHQEVVVANQTIKTLSLPDYFLYLMVHGSKHRWYSLRWLNDFATLLSRMPEEDQNHTIQQAIRMGLHKPLIQSYVLARLLYGTPLVDQIRTLYDREPGIDSFIIRALASVKTTGYTAQLPKINKTRYLLKLKKDRRYHLKILLRLSTHHKDWSIVALPDALFFLYYVLRPFLYLIRVIKRKK